jgi:hypothetical protein
MIHAFDIESHLIDKGMPLPKGVCLSFASEDGTTGVMLMEDGLEWVREKLARGDTLIAHNARFDLGVCAADDPSLLKPIFQAYAEGRIRDTGIRQKILDNARGALKFEWNPETGEYKAQRFTLAHLVKRLLNKWIFDSKEGDVWRLRYYTLADTPIEEWPADAINYALEDSIYALQCYLVQERDDFAYLLDKEWSQTQADWALGLMSAWGSRTDAEDIEELRQVFQDEYDDWANQCIELGLARWAKKTKKEREASPGTSEYKVVRNMKVIQDLVVEHYGKYKLDVPMTEGGKGEVKNPQVSTARDTLLMLAHRGIEPLPGMVAVSNMVRVGKQLSTYIKMLLLGTEYPINPNYNAIIETFRTSCRGPNVQNLPRGGGVRDCWIPRPGYVFGFCDYDTLEMRTLAQVYLWMLDVDTCPLLEATIEGKDLHLEFAAKMLDLTYEEAEQRMLAGDKVVEETRQGAKIANYGMAGGMGPEAFVEYARGFGVDISIERATELRDAFRRVWSMHPYFEHCSQVAEYRDPQLGINLVEFFGSGLIRGDVPYTAVCNGYFQHLAAMGAKKALFEVSKACYTDESSPLYGCRPWLFAHDEIGMEVPFDGTDAGRVRASNAMKELERIMVECMEFYCPDVPIGATAALSFRWYKGAKPVHRKIANDNVLVPCVKEGKHWVEQMEAA